jgi:hypothetical protein
MSSPSISYAESVLSHLEKVQKLPIEMQADIAKRVDTYLNVARAANSEAILATVASTAMQEQAKAIGEGGTMDPRWAPTGTGNCRSMVLCHDEPVQRLPRSIARASDHQSN